MKLKRILSLSLVVLLGISVIGCGNGTGNAQSDTGNVPETGSETEAGTDSQDTSEAVETGDPVELTLMAWDGGTGEAAEVIIHEIIDDFNKEYEGRIKILPEYLPSEETKTKLPTLMAANSAPDMFMSWSAGYLEPYVTAGKVYSLQEALDNDSEWKSMFIDGIMDQVTYDGQICAIPTVLSTQVAYYNKEIYDKFNLPIPKTHEEYIEGLKIIRDSGEDIIPMAFGNSTAWPSASHSEILANRIGGNDPFNKALDGSGTWTDESFIKAATLLQEMVEEKLVPDGYAGMTPEEAVEQFKSGKAASFIWSSYCISNFEAEDSAIKDKTILAKCPTVENGRGDENNWLGQADKCLVISERCENKEAAVTFLKYYTQTRYMQKMADAGTLTTIKAENLDMSNVGPIAGQIMQLHSDMTGLFVFYDVVLGSVVGNEYNNTVQGIMAGDDAQEAFENFQQFFEDNYNK